MIIEDHYRFNQGPGLLISEKGWDLDVPDFPSEVSTIFISVPDVA